MARVGDEYWLCFTARQASNALAIGLAKSREPGRSVDRHRPAPADRQAGQHRRPANAR